MTQQYPNKVGTKEWILSEEYPDALRVRYNSEEKKICGAWRWGAMLTHRKIIAKHVFSDEIGIDFGGYDGPIGGNSKIIDKNDNIHKINDRSLDYIFTSHTLEHVDDIESILKNLWWKLKIGGNIMIHVPSYQKRVWRHVNDPDHNYTFKLHETHFGLAYNIDDLVEEAGFKILNKEYCYKNCIWIYGEKL